MKQIELCKRMLSRPNLYAHDWQRAALKKRLTEKMKRRDRKIVKQTQLKLL